MSPNIPIIIIVLTQNLSTFFYITLLFELNSSASHVSLLIFVAVHVF